jgi:NAD(P)H-nitrite reductase large subunit
MRQFIIIGNSAAGIATVEAIRQRDKTSKILVFSDEDYPAYCRCLISYYLAGDIKEDKILYRAESFYKENNIELLLNKKVMRIDPKKNRIVCEDKTQFNYDALLIATGASPKFPKDLKGIKKRGVFGFRTIKDTKEIEGLLPVTKTTCVLGGGLIGLKAAYALSKRKIEVKVIVKSKQVLSQMLDFEAASLVQKKLQENGIEIILGQDAAEVIGNGDIRALKLDSGKAIGTSLIIVGKGVEPNIDLIKGTEIKFNEGIIANNFLQTNIRNIYTAGDVCESFDITLRKHTVNALWPVAIEQGKIAGCNMAGDNLNYDGSLGMNSIDFFGLPFISLGIYRTQAGDSSFEELKLMDPKINLYKKLILKDNVLIGAILVGDIKQSGIFLRLIRERIEVLSLKDRLLQENFGFPDIMDLIKEEKEKIYV